MVLQNFTDVWLSRLNMVIRTVCSSSKDMALSKYEYVKSFEMDDRLDPMHWIVIQLNFLEFERPVTSCLIKYPGDHRFFNLMSAAGKSVMEYFKDIVLGYGYSSEFSFVFRKNTTLYKRRESKLLSYVTSLMTSAFVSHWPEYMSMKLKAAPFVEGCVHLLPNDQILRDYLTKQQLCCHHRNLTNTALLNLVHKAGLSVVEAENLILNASEGHKNELLFSMCNVNYNNEPNLCKKGSVILRVKSKTAVNTPDGEVAKREQSTLQTLHVDMNKDSFWSTSFIVDNTSHSCKNYLLEYFENKHKLLPHTWVVVRIDGMGFHKFSEMHNFEKPNDRRALELMNLSALEVMKAFPSIVLGYGQSDEYSFVIGRYETEGCREANSLTSHIVSKFSGSYAGNWSSVFDTSPQYNPAFDARVVMYPTNTSLRHYMNWRQVDCHINNLYNTCYWALRTCRGLTGSEAVKYLSGTVSSDKREILKNEFGIMYDDLEPLYRKGTVMYRSEKLADSQDCEIKVEHNDIIGDNFWSEKPWILGTG